jgi:hypothetical protein
VLDVIWPFKDIIFILKMDPKVQKVVNELVELHNSIGRRLHGLCNNDDVNFEYLDTQLKLFDQTYNDLKSKVKTKTNDIISTLPQFLMAVYAELYFRKPSIKLHELFVWTNIKPYLRDVKTFVNKNTNLVDLNLKTTPYSGINLMCSMSHIDLTYILNALALPKPQFEKFIEFTVNWIIDTVENADLIADLSDADIEVKNDDIADAKIQNLVDSASDLMKGQVFDDNILDLFKNVYDNFLEINTKDTDNLRLKTERVIENLVKSFGLDVHVNPNTKGGITTQMDNTMLGTETKDYTMSQSTE